MCLYMTIHKATASINLAFRTDKRFIIYLLLPIRRRIPYIFNIFYRIERSGYSLKNAHGELMGSHRRNESFPRENAIRLLSRFLVRHAIFATSPRDRSLKVIISIAHIFRPLFY